MKSRIGDSDLINVRFGPLCGLKAHISRGPRSAKVSIRWGPRGRADVAELAARSGSVSDACWRVPIPGQKLVDVLGRMI